MKAFCFTLTILCAVQSILAYPRPELAINGAVGNSAQVNTAGVELDTAVTKVGADTATLTSGYTLLTTVSNNLQAIGDAIVTPGNELATALKSLSSDASGQVATVYDGVIAKVDAFTAVLNSPFSGKLAAIATDTGSFIGTQFADSFKAAKTTLTALRSALVTLKNDVQAAKNAGGSGAIPPSIIRSKIPARSVNQVITQTRTLASNMPVIAFVINSSLDNLEMVDTFIREMKDEVVRGVASYANSISAFQLLLQTQKTNYNNKLSSGLGDTVTSRISSISSNLQLTTQYTSTLQPKISALNDVYTTTLAAKTSLITGVISSYSSNVPSLITNLQSSLGNALCNPIKTVSLIQIANGPNSDFCFSKFSPRVFSQIALTLDAFDLCFEKEVARLMPLEDIIFNIAEQISYTAADLFDNLSVCLSLPDANKPACYAMLTPYYDTLANRANLHLTTIVDLVTAEAKASYNRLGACLYVSLSSTTISATEIASNANTCQTTGPQP